MFQEQVRRQAEDENIRVFILRMKNARHLDATTVMALESLHDYLRKTDRYLLISGSSPDVTRVLRNSGLLKQIGEENIFPAEINPDDCDQARPGARPGAAAAEGRGPAVLRPPHGW